MINFIKIGEKWVNPANIVSVQPYHSGSEEEGVDESMIVLADGSSITVVGEAEKVARAAGDATPGMSLKLG